MEKVSDYQAFVDLETGGLIPGRHGITQMSVLIFQVIRFEGDGPIEIGQYERWATKVQPDVSQGLEYDSKALEMQGETTASLLAEGLPMDQAFFAFEAFLSKYIPRENNSGRIWAHEAAFDWAMVRKSMVEKIFTPGYYQHSHFAGERIDWTCTKHLYRALKALGVVPELNQENLRYIAQFYGVQYPEGLQHRAVGDSEVSLKCLWHILNDYQKYFRGSI
jgi:hypothetical protein